MLLTIIAITIFIVTIIGIIMLCLFIFTFQKSRLVRFGPLPLWHQGRCFEFFFKWPGHLALVILSKLVMHSVFTLYEHLGFVNRQNVLSKLLFHFNFFFFIPKLKSSKFSSMKWLWTQREGHGVQTLHILASSQSVTPMLGLNS